MSMPSGAYYHWYLKKRLIAEYLRALGRDEIMALSCQLDRTNYSELCEALPPERGGRLSIFRTMAIIFSPAIMMIERLSSKREVFMVCGDPNGHPGNEVFDRLADELFSHAGCQAFVLHSNRPGIARAIMVLQAGKIVLMIPDVYLRRGYLRCPIF